MNSIPCDLFDNIVSSFLSSSNDVFCIFYSFEHDYVSSSPLFSLAAGDITLQHDSSFISNWGSNYSLIWLYCFSMPCNAGKPFYFSIFSRSDSPQLRRDSVRVVGESSSSKSYLMKWGSDATYSVYSFNTFLDFSFHYSISLIIFRFTKLLY
jgi:hypothetical protein